MSPDPYPEPGSELPPHLQPEVIARGQAPGHARTILALAMAATATAWGAFTLPHMRWISRELRPVVRSEVVVLLTHVPEEVSRSSRAAVAQPSRERGGAADIRYRHLPPPPHTLADLPMAASSTLPSEGDVLMKLGPHFRVGGTGSGFSPDHGAGRGNRASHAVNTTPSVGDPTQRVLGSEEIKALLMLAPAYPREARASRLQGDVTVRFTVDEQGVPSQIVVESGDPIFHPSAREILPLWRFQPILHEGRAVSVKVRMTLRYRLEES